jgi:hypothetical protein
MCWNLVLETEADRVEELDVLAAQLDQGLPARPRQFVCVPVPKHSTAVLLQGSCETADQSGRAASLDSSFGDMLTAVMSDLPAPVKMGDVLHCSNSGQSNSSTAAAVVAWEFRENRGQLAPVACLDQLLAQASGVDRLVRPKVQAWGMRCGAYYRLAGTHSHVIAFEPWADLHRYPGGGDGFGSGTSGRVRWAQCKSRQRAVEKLYRVYRLDVSMLVRTLLPCVWACRFLHTQLHQ